MEPREYITYKAMIECEEGSAPGLFTPTYNQTVKINSCKVSTALDKIPLTNIPNFVVCKKTQKPCVPVPTTWEDTYPVKVKGQQTLIGKSCIKCSVGGKIKFQTSGQVPLSPEEEEQLNGMRDDVKKAYDKEQEEKNKPWWKKAGEFIVDCVPVVGPIVSMAKNISEGNWGMALLDVGFLALDVVGVVGAPFTGGASLAGSTALKIGARQAIKAGAKQLAKKAGKEALEAGAKQAAEMISKLSMRSLSKGRLCVFACFPAGTPVAVRNGHKNIEDLRAGDEVWAYNETTGETSLHAISYVWERNVHMLVTIHAGTEKITTTADHPFYADGAWKEAGLLEPGNTLQRRDGKQVVVMAVEFHYNRENAPASLLQTGAGHQLEDIGSADEADENSWKVYNFEVTGAHTYFVGDQEILVHNAGGVCVRAVVKKVSARLRYLGRTPGKGSKTGREVFERMKKTRPPTARIKNGKKQFKSKKDGKWYDLDKADMAHKRDAVDWWNKVARKKGYKPKGKEVREWMLDSKNYYLEHRSYNRSDGASLGKTYLPPFRR